MAATVWGLQEPLDRRLFRCDYSDVKLVGGLGVHAFNGALFGVAFDFVRRRTSVDQRRLAIGLALAEHTLLWPVLGLIEPEIVRKPRAFAQGMYRHALFGAVLGRLA
ncbi:MAG: hypothetical protein ACJ74D_05135 [Gaiellaceae bacterium]